MEAKSRRPVLRLSPTSEEIALAWLSAIVVGLTVFILLNAWVQLPDRVPTHFGVSGAPDAWGTRSTLLGLPVMSLVMYFVFGLLVRYPWWFNYPWLITQQNAEAQYRLACGLISWLRLEIVCIFGFITWTQIRVALNEMAGLQNGPMLAALGVVMGTAAVHIILMHRAR